MIFWIFRPYVAKSNQRLVQDTGQGIDGSEQNGSVTAMGNACLEIDADFDAII